MIKKFNEYTEEEINEAMNFLRLHDLVEVSNNSRLTNEVLVMLQDKLSTEDIVKFKQWLMIIKRGY